MIKVLASADIYGTDLMRPAGLEIVAENFSGKLSECCSLCRLKLALLGGF